MATLADINAQIKQHEEQIAQLRANAEVQRKEQMASVVADIRAKIAEFGITAADLKLGKAPRGRIPRAPSVSTAKGKTYHGPGGQTWSEGTRGRKPGWLAEQIAKPVEQGPQETANAE